MSELDEKWSKLLSNAIERANATGRGGVADYLELKATNDAVRRAGTKWLLDTFTELAGVANRRSAALAIERDEPHNFRIGNANMAGSLLRIKHGIRCLTIETGWTRTPTDGVMPRGALAAARIVHFGIPKANAELLLVNVGGQRVWNVVDKDGRASHFGFENAAAHFGIFIGAG